MPVETILFGVTAFIVVASALMVVLSSHPIHSALYLVLTFLGLAGFYLELSAAFIAAVQVIVYAGAIMVLFLFVIMLLGEDKPLEGEAGLGKHKWVGAVLSLVLIGIIGFGIARPHGPGDAHPGPVDVIGQADKADFGSVKAIGTTLFTDYVFAFEATSVILLIAMVGIVALAKRRL